MPAIYLFGRRTLIGGDDLQPAAIVSIIGRIIQIIFLCGPIIKNVVLIKNNNNNSNGYCGFIHWFFSTDDNNCCNNNDDSNSNNNIMNRYHLYCFFITVWILLSICYCIASFIIEIYIIYWSSQGSPTEILPRSIKVSELLEYKILYYTIALLITWITGFTSLCFAIQNSNCNTNNDNNNNNQEVFDDDDTVRNLVYISFSNFRQNMQLWWIAAAALLLSQIIESILSLIFLGQLYYTPLDLIDESSERSQSSLPFTSQVTNNDENAMMMMMMDARISSAQQYSHELVEEMWAERCAGLCHCLSASSCYMFGGRNVVNSTGPAEFGDVARALADFLESRGVLNIVPSDVVMGLIVLQRLQRQRIYAARLQVLQNLSNKTVIVPIESGLLVEDGTSMIPKKTTQRSNIIRRKHSSGHLAGGSDDEDNGGNGSVHSGGISPRSNNNNGNNSNGTGTGIFRSSSDELLLSRSFDDSLHSTEPNHRAVYRFDNTGNYQEEERDVLDRTNPIEMSILEETAHYSKYALAIYTWVLYLYKHPITGPARLLIQNKCSCFNNNCCTNYKQQKNNTTISNNNATTPSTTLPLNNTNFATDIVDENGRIGGDNLCQVHKSAILLTAGIDNDADIVYVQLKSSFCDNPYSILLDHKWKSVVVSIRGTFSLEDCVTDVLIEPESLEQLGEEFGFNGYNQYCHGGVLACVRNVYRDLERHGLLDRLLLNDNAPYADYTLRLVGHSLGAATCALLSYILKPKYPTLRCVNYSPPGCTFTWELATQCKEWCVSCVLDSDLVPRLSFDAMERLRNEILDLIGRVKVPKIEVARRFLHTSALWGFRLCHEEVVEDRDALIRSMQDILHEPDEVPESEYQKQLTKFKEIQKERRTQRGHSRSIQLYPPGRMLHLAKTGEVRSCTVGITKCITCCTSNAGSRYVPVWINNDDLNEIVVSSTMGTDHFPDRIQAILEEVAQEFGITW